MKSNKKGGEFLGSQNPSCQIGPSILSADLSCLADVCNCMMGCGADYLHLDVMDGHFVPNITIGPPVIKALRKKSTAFFDAHMMVSNPEKWVEPMSSAGVGLYTFHLEATEAQEDPSATTKLIKQIRDANMYVGIAIKPGTKVEEVLPYVSSIDMVLVMTVEPGFGGQRFMTDMMPKVNTLRLKYSSLHIGVDGGVSPTTVADVAKAGATMLVSGSAVVKSKDPKKVIATLKKKWKKHQSTTTTATTDATISSSNSTKNKRMIGCQGDMNERTIDELEKIFFGLFKTNVYCPGKWDKKCLIRAIMEKKEKNKESQLVKDSSEWIKVQFKKKYATLVDDFLLHLQQKYLLREEHLTRVRTLLDYTIPGGKQYRGNLVFTTIKAFTKDDKSKLDQSGWDRALILGWCIEILQACFLVADDIMDQSITRRGKPCWYKQKGIGLDAINDSILLEALIYFVLKQYFSSTPTLYLKLIELYHEVSLTTEVGQMLDLVSAPQVRKNPNVLNNFTMDLYRLIVHNKTAIYTFYLPIASAMILIGADNVTDLQAVRTICLELGEKFQIEDDYLDCYGDPEVIGKVGTDIQDLKCSWLIVQALSLMTKAQRKLVNKHYGKDNEESIALVKKIYLELNLSDIYDKQEDDSLLRIEKLIANNPQLPASLFTSILKKIHNRIK